MTTDLQNPALTLYGTVWCSDCKRSKKFLGEQRVHYAYVDIEEDADAAALVERLNNGHKSVPTIVFPDGSFLVEPSNTVLAEKLGLTTRAKLSYYDLIVVGGGPAGLTAALYAAREGMDVLVLERSAFGGQASVTERLENFPGFPEGITGGEFADRLKQQAERFGVELVQAVTVKGVYREGESVYVRLSTGGEVGARAMVIATGSNYRRLDVPGEAGLIGAGVHFCATCDGPFYRGRDIVVVGGGNSAAEEALFLARFASSITMLVRGDALRASQIIIDKVLREPRIKIRYGTRITALHGEKKLAAVTVAGKDTGTTEDLHPAAVFVFIGLSPNAEWVGEAIPRDAQGFIITDERLMTGCPGIFAAGDVRRGATKQVASAVGEGATAALMVREYLRHARG